MTVLMNVQEDDVLYMLDYVGPSGFAVEASSQAGRYPLLSSDPVTERSVSKRRRMR